jgi:hypothetical protein
MDPSIENPSVSDVPPPWFRTLVDPMDDEGLVRISPELGLGYDINWDYINKNLVD